MQRIISKSLTTSSSSFLNSSFTHTLNTCSFSSSTDHSQSKLAWPPLERSKWADTQTLTHMLVQMMGKTRLGGTPWTNHSWHTTLYTTPRGFTTGLIPTDTEFSVELDALDSVIRFDSADGQRHSFSIRTGSIADHYEDYVKSLSAIGCSIKLNPKPCEIPTAVPFHDDKKTLTFDPAALKAFHRICLSTDKVFRSFRANYTGKVSPVHLFFGAMDLAVTRFHPLGKKAPPHPAGMPGMPDWVAREAYSHEVISAGFWPGDDSSPAVYYAYCYPTPPTFKDQTVGPKGAFWLDALGEFVIPYSVVAESEDPVKTLTEFLDSTYAAAAKVLDWDTKSTEIGNPEVDHAKPPAK